MRVLIVAVVAVLSIVILALVGWILFHTQRYKHLEDTHDLLARIDQKASEYVAKRPNGALVVGVIQGDKSVVRGYGSIAKGANTPPDGRTLFEIGSVTKVFTALALSKLDAEGLVRLDDPLVRHAPAEVKLPDEFEAITLKHLATHTSGLPRLPDDFFEKTEGHNDNPYAFYHTNDLYESLARTKLRSTPGRRSDYSNLGAGLLGHVLAFKAGTSYEALIKDGLCVPMGMDDTTIALTTDQRSRLVPGHSPKGEPVPNWDFDVLAPAGAFRSTADDMLRFLRANLGEADEPLASILNRAQEEQFSAFSGTLGLGWHIRRTLEGPVIHWHNGGTGGYKSFVGFDKPHQTGIVLLSNHGDAFAGDESLEAIGFDVLILASKVSLEPTE